MQTQDAVKGSHNFLEFSQLSLMLRWKYKYGNMEEIMHCLNIRLVHIVVYDHANFKFDFERFSPNSRGEVSLGLICGIVELRQISAENGERFVRYRKQNSTWRLSLSLFSCLSSW